MPRAARAGRAGGKLIRGAGARGRESCSAIEPLESRRLLSTTAPQLVSADYRFDAPQPQVRAQFSEPVAPETAAADLVLVNLTTGQTIPSSAIAVVPDSSGDSVTFAFPGLPNGVLPDGNYRATLPASSVHSLAGDGMDGEAKFDFFVLGADANRDRVVDTIDFNILAGNFGRSDRDFSHANFDYSADGKVDTIDFNHLASRFGQSLPAPSDAPTGAAAPASSVASSAPMAFVQMAPVIGLVGLGDADGMMPG